MQAQEEELGRPETLVAALMYLMTQHARSRCPRIANCITRHLQCLALHPAAAPVVRDMCAALAGAWDRDGEAGGSPAAVH
ncbi:MAG TPA: hypothetical protein VGI18_14320 [Burkholderiales bacterium]|jgi:hypothetical protein